ncbi:DNA-binding response regulator [Thiohalobacter sp. COW1]|uniref:Response regulator receiver n=1 Tax=Thiohalobacter thiocyanaticus TaxID=585455 RepID=A0A1Z4VTG7_9GAMM|nr:MULTISPECIES: response regulator transcription factor [Thiohalobacter]BAZ94940.1 response regulator receiver [Thiohalobacter thiocyanaticus]BCO33147.1 DNA-binding response regulator [Thiohalobacter sp. COW1]
MRLLLVEDDASLAGRLRQDLQAAGYAVDHCDNGIDAEHLGLEEPYDAVILDLGLPGRSGLEVLGRWRREGLDTPVLILTARDAWHEKVEGFQAGADDYLGKPFHVEELQARLSALLRRASGRAAAQLSVNGLSLDEATQTVTTPDGATHALTGTEFRLLRYFMLHPDHILSKTELTEHVYDYDSDKDSNVIEVYVRRLRSKLGADLIETRRGQGYCFPAR